MTAFNVSLCGSTYQGGPDKNLANTSGCLPFPVVGILKKVRKVVNAHYYPNEGHGLNKQINRLRNSSALAVIVLLP